VPLLRHSRASAKSGIGWTAPSRGAAVSQATTEAEFTATSIDSLSVRPLINKHPSQLLTK
jgi:hypothetical protein